MTKYEKAGLKNALFCIIFCALAAIIISSYLIIPKDLLSKEIKDYYISSYIDNCNKLNENEISLYSLIKKGYAKKSKEFDEYLCNYKTSYIIKDKEIITLVLSCKNYTNNYVIKIGDKNDY